MSKDTFWIGIDTFDCIIVGKRRQYDVRFGCEFTDAVSDRCAVFNQRLSSFATPVVRDDLVAVVEQTFSHAASHVADANKAESGIFLGERVHFTLLPFDRKCATNCKITSDDSLMNTRRDQPSTQPPTVWNKRPIKNPTTAAPRPIATI